MSDMKRRLIVVALLLFTGSVAVNGRKNNTLKSSLTLQLALLAY